MNRTAAYKALVLRVRPSGEHREAFFLTAEEGLLRATVFGGPKSRFRSHVAPFHSGRLIVYHDPVKDTRKVSEFDVASWRPGLRELYERSEAAAELAACVLKSGAGAGINAGGGAYDDAVELAVLTLDALENAAEKSCLPLVLRFMWNWADLLGQRPAPDRCSLCGGENPDGLLWFVRNEGLLCERCVRQAAAAAGFFGAAAYGLAVGAGARRWLAAVEGRPPSETLRISLDEASLADAKALTKALLDD